MKEEINVKYIKNYINTYQSSVDQIRRHTLFFLILFIDVFLPFMMLIGPSNQTYTNLFVSIIVVLNLFAIYIIINPYKRQIVVHLYFGSVGIGLSLGSFLFALKVYYVGYGGTSPLFLIVSSCILIGLILIGFRWNSQKIKSGFYVNPNKNRSKKKTVKSVLTTIGIYIFAIAFALTSVGRHPHHHADLGPFRNMIELLNISVLFLLIATILLVIPLQRYFLILKHRDWFQVAEQKPTKKKHKGA